MIKTPSRQLSADADRLVLVVGMRNDDREFAFSYDFMAPNGGALLHEGKSGAKPRGQRSPNSPSPRTAGGAGEGTSMKIAFVNQPFDRILPPLQNSIGICTYGLARSLANFADVIVYGNRELHEDVPSDLTDDGVRFRFLSSRARERILFSLHRKLNISGVPISRAITADWAYPGLVREVAMDLRKEGCDVVHIQNFSQYVPVIRSFNPHVKIVYQQHAAWFCQHDRRRLARRFKDVDLFAGVSDYLADTARRHFPMVADHLATIYNGIDPKEFRPVKDYRAARSRNEKRLLYAGNFSPSKGLHVLLDAFKLVLQRYPNVLLDIVGRNFSYALLDMFDREDPALIASVKPWYAPHYAAHIKAWLSLAPKDAGSYAFRLKASLPPEVAAKVSFLDQMPHAELANRYVEADVFVFPPLSPEGFGLPPVEAMAAGTPVVATCSGGIVETVRDGETGILVAKNDASALAQAILQLLEDDALRERMGRAARAWALGHFTWDRIAERAYTMYKTLSVPAPV